jgi:hypothetical protein
MYYLSIGCIFKNESCGLYEFIEHNILHGIEHIYLINDFSNDNFIEILQPYINIGILTLYNNDIITKDHNRQSLIYNKYFKPILHETKWIAIIDIDEFLYSQKDINISNIIKKYDDEYDNILVEWITFGSNNCEYQPFSIVSGFTKHCILDGKTYYSYKSIIKTNKLESFGIHLSNISSNKTINLSYTTNKNELYINHYQTQSKEFYINIKAIRGDCDNHYDYIGLKRDLERFNNTNIYCNEIENYILYEQNNNIIKKVKENKVKLLNNICDKSVSVIITSCNRPLLLEKTFESFIKYNTYPIKDYIIIDDSGIIGVNDFLLNKYKNIKFNLIYNKKNLGQVKSIDIAYEYITTNYIFHCEEDWEFLEYGFIELSFDILKNDDKIFTVWLRPHNETSNHPIIYDNTFNNCYKMKTDFSYNYNNKTYIWCGVTFNPGLRKTKDILLYHPYNKNIKKDLDLNEVGEYVINEKYRLDGYYGVITKLQSGYCKHIGQFDHVKRSYE